MNAWYSELLGKYSVLLAAALLLFVLEPLLSVSHGIPWGLSLITFLLVIGSLRAVWTSIALIRTVTILGVANVACEAAEPFERLYMPIATDVFSIALLGVTGIGILVDIFARERITADTVFGASAVYLLTGLLFARLFLLLAHLDPDAFAYSEALIAQIDAAGSLRETGILHYFSLITLTTVGYGDVSPVAPLARNLSAVEAVIGQLFVAAVIARFVAIQTTAEH